MNDHNDALDDMDDADVSASIDSLLAAQREVLEGIRRITARIEASKAHQGAVDPDHSDALQCTQDSGLEAIDGVAASFVPSAMTK